MASFIHTPPIIFAAADQISRLPQILTVVSHPDLSRLLIDAHAPRISQPIGPVLRPRIGHPEKWIVFWNRVTLRSADMIHINAQDAAQQFAQILTRIPSVRVARSIARRDIKHSIVTKYDATAIVPLRMPFDDKLL